MPVLAVGIPTVVDVDPEAGLFLTPRDIDQRIRELGRLLGYGITLALQPSLTAADVTACWGRNHQRCGPTVRTFDVSRMIVITS